MFLVLPVPCCEGSVFENDFELRFADLPTLSEPSPGRKTQNLRIVSLPDSPVATNASFDAVGCCTLPTTLTGYQLLILCTACMLLSGARTRKISNAPSLAVRENFLESPSVS